MPFSFSNLKSRKKERSLKGTGSSCNSRTFNVDAANDDDDDDDDDDNDDDDYGVVVEVLIGSLSNYDDDHNNDFKKTIGLMIKTKALHLHNAF